jgi:TolB-like protein
LRRLLAFFVLCALPLAVAAAPGPTPRPSPSPAASIAATPVPGAPAVIIFPFETPSDLDPKYGTAVANIYATVLSQTGGITVLAIPPVIKREDYQTYARIHKADYYISGFIQPIGGNAAIVSQVVDVSSDISVYSATTQAANVNDIGSQALNARQVIMEASGIDRPQLQSATTTDATPQPQSSASGASIGISSIVSDLFKGKGHAQPAPAKTPLVPKPSRGVIVARLLGSAVPRLLHNGSDELFRAMDQHFKTSFATVPTQNLANQADSICGSNRDNTIASGLLDATHVGGFRPHDSYTFTLNVYACFGAVMYTVAETNDDYNAAIEDAVAAYYASHPNNF